MNKCHQPITWHNDTTPALNETNLNYEDGCIDIIDDRVVAMDTAKLEAEDVATVIKNIQFSDTTGIFTFTRYDNSTFTLDTKLEKVVTNWTYDSSTQSLVLTLADGSTVNVPLSDFITETEFEDSATIGFTVLNHTVTAVVKGHSIGDAQMQTGYLTDCQAAASTASAAATSATNKATLAESYAVGGTGTRAGEDTDNAKYYKEQAAAIVNMSFSGLSDTDFNNLQDGQVAVYNSTSQMWENEDMSAGLLPHVIVISDTGSTVTLTKGAKVITASETSIGHFEADVDEYGTWTIDSILAGDDAQTTLNIDAVKVYTITDEHFSASITVSYPSGGTCTLSATGQTPQAATGSPYTFTVHAAATYTLTATYRGATRTATIVISTTGQTETYSFLVDGATVLTTDDVEIWLDCACLWDKSYTTEAEIIADSEALLALISDHNAVDYMARSASFRTLICADALAMLYIGQYNYCANTLLANATWLAEICGSEYFELVLTGEVPRMTSDATPSGTASASSMWVRTDKTFYPYLAFSRSTADTWVADASCAYGQSSSGWIQYQFDAPMCIIGFSCAQSNNMPITAYTLKGSNDGSTWDTLNSGSSINDTECVGFANTSSYLYYRLEITERNDVNSGYNSNLPRVNMFQLYARENATPPETRALKTFATANEAEILEMVCQADRGEIDLYDDAGWRVGQEHSVTLAPIGAYSVFYNRTNYNVGETQPAQTATLVLANHGGVELVNSVLDKQGQTRTQCSFEYDWKNCFPERGYMNASGTNSGSWDGCARRAWCNYGLRNAVSPYIRAASHQFKTITAETYNGSTNKTSNDYFALRAEKEIFGSVTYSNPIEAAALTQKTLYKTTANQFKQINGTNVSWKGRSPDYSNSARFCNVSSGAAALSSVASDTNGIAPFGAF